MISPGNIVIDIDKAVCGRDWYVKRIHYDNIESRDYSPVCHLEHFQLIAVNLDQLI